MINTTGIIIGVGIAAGLFAVNKLIEKNKPVEGELLQPVSFEFWNFNDQEDYIIKYKDKEGEKVTPRPVPAYKMQETLYRLQQGGAKIIDFWGYDFKDQEGIKRKIRAIRANIEISQGEQQNASY
ncbi:hypothetical protein BAU67_001935 [Escherichia coli]|nr:hypothetical protein [Escherichia coli]